MAKAKTDKITDETENELPTNKVVETPEVNTAEEVPARLTEEEVLTPEVKEKSEKALIEEPVKAPVISDAEVNKIANERERNLRAAWAQEKKVTIMVPFAPDEENVKPTPIAEANINGISIRFPKNEYVELPESVAQLFKDSQRQTSQALNQMKIDGNEDKEKALI
jgi:hypothetical protein